MSARPCDSHPDRASTFTCMVCNHYACSDCAKHTWKKDHFEDACARCGRPMDPVLTAVIDEGITHERGVPQLLSQVPSILAFPFRKATLIMMFGLALLCAPLYWAIGNIFTPGLLTFGLFLILTIEASVYFRIVVQSAYGKADIEMDFTDLALGLFAPALRYLATLVPIVVSLFWYGEAAAGTMWGGLLVLLEPTLILTHAGPAALFVTGVLVWPLLTVIAAMNESVLAIFNPGTWVRCVQVMGATYFVGALGFYALLAFEYLVLLPALESVRGSVDIFMLTRLSLLFVTYLAFAMRARLLGIMVEPYIGTNDS